MHRGVAAGVAAVILFGPASSGISLVRSWRDVKDGQFRCRHALDEYDHHRLEELKQVVPGRGLVGYFEDGPEPVPYSKFTLTQYSLAPLLVVPHPNALHVIGNFRRPETQAPPDPRPFELLVDFGNGVKWYRRAPE